MTDSGRDTFERDRYAVMRGVIAEPLLGFLWRYVLQRGAAGTKPGDAADAALYREMELEHWRERYEGVRAAQVSLH